MLPRAYQCVQQGHQVPARSLGDFLDREHHLLNTFFFLCLFRAAPTGAAPAACGSSQARGCIGAAATSLHHSHSHARSEAILQPTPQLKATLDP